ncbi:DUF4179 domain-containing protein [Metabacillus idriensis]|uniref:DUF4179 domain-containing protein n=1 Tax=Metabacillus idriensis TaxID=324768 RepID=UPI001748A800|nr:DUF4179 domain-containing protein [Metabacillus idriensis]
MDNIEKHFDDAKRKMESIQVPEELETRLRNSLQSAPVKRRKRSASLVLTAAAAIFLLGFITFQYNAFAFYGKKLLGFDELCSGTLNELNEKGLGQMIEKKTTLGNGTIFELNGVMADGNQFVMFYTLSNPAGMNDDSIYEMNPARITGLFTNSHSEYGTSQLNETGTELKGILSFEPVSPFSKELTLHFSHLTEIGQLKEEKLTFPFNPNKAMQSIVKQPIKQTLNVDKGKITFSSIKATPTMTVIEGKLNVDNFDRVDFALGGIELRANGKPVPLTGGGSKSSLIGKTFDISYDALPEKLETLELVLKEFAGYQQLNEKITLASNENEIIKLSGKELMIKKVSMTSQGAEITIATDDDVMLDGVSIASDDIETPIKTTIKQTSTKQENGRVMKERTLIFETETTPEVLLIEGFHYMKLYNDSIMIPVD